MESATRIFRMFMSLPNATISDALVRAEHYASYWKPKKGQTSVYFPEMDPDQAIEDCKYILKHSNEILEEYN
jgi:hypothetical protein